MSIIHDLKIHLAELIKQKTDNKVQVLTLKSNFYRYPFIFLGRSELKDWSSKTFEGVDIRQCVDVCFNNESASQAASIVDTLCQVMDFQELRLAEGNIINFEWIKTTFQNFDNYSKYSCVFRIKIIKTGE